jgi:hypothetical protein
LIYFKIKFNKIVEEACNDRCISLRRRVPSGATGCDRIPEVSLYGLNSRF